MRQGGHFVAEVDEDEIAGMDAEGGGFVAGFVGEAVAGAAVGFADIVGGEGDFEGAVEAADVGGLGDEGAGLGTGAGVGLGVGGVAKRDEGEGQREEEFQHATGIGAGG